MPYTPSGIGLPADLNPGNFSGVGGNVGSQEVNRTIFSYDPFAIYQAVAQRHATFPSFRQMLRMTRAARGVSAPTTGHYEAPWKNNNLPLGTIQTASSGAGTNVIFNLAAGAMFDSGVTVGGAARQASFVRVNDIIQAYDGSRAQVIAKNTTVTPHRITLRPLLAADDLAGSFAASTTYAIFDNAWGEGDGLPESVVPRLIQYTNVFQTIKEGASATGTENTNVMFAQYVPGQDGTVFLAMQGDAMYRYERSMCYALLFGTQSDNLTTTPLKLGYDVPVITTEGLIPFIEGNGNVDTYTTNAYAITDFDVMATIFDQERAGSMKIITYDGWSIFQETENALQDLLNANLSVELMKDLNGDSGIPLDSFQPYANEDFSFYIGFRALKKSGYTFFFRKLHELSEFNGAGFTGYSYPGYRMAVPLGFATNKQNGDGMPYVSYEYKKGLNGYDRHDLARTFGGVGASNGPAVDEYDRVQMGIVSEIAGHFAVANQMIIQKPA